MELESLLSRYAPRSSAQAVVCISETLEQLVAHSSRE
jgi:hypothetical protein